MFQLRLSAADYVERGLRQKGIRVEREDLDYASKLIYFSGLSTLKTRRIKITAVENHSAEGTYRACSFASGARDIAESVASWFARWITKPLNPSAIAEQAGHPAAYSGPNMRW